MADKSRFSGWWTKWKRIQGNSRKDLPVRRGGLRIALQAGAQEAQGEKSKIFLPRMDTDIQGFRMCPLIIRLREAAMAGQALISANRSLIYSLNSRKFALFAVNNLIFFLRPSRLQRYAKRFAQHCGQVRFFAAKMFA